MRLRLLRQLAGPGARHLSGKVKPAPASPGSYLADNSTVQGRAQNRGVRIAVQVRGHIRCGGRPGALPGPQARRRGARVHPAGHQRGRALFGRTGKWDQFGMPINEAKRRRSLCLVGQIAKGKDMRYLTADAVDRYDRYANMAGRRNSRRGQVRVPDRLGLGARPLTSPNQVRERQTRKSRAK